MAIQAPGKRYGPRLRDSVVFGHAHTSKAAFADLNVTPLVDMFVILVLFLIANFSATGDILHMSKDVRLPEATHTKALSLAPVVLITTSQVLLSGGALIGTLDDLNRDDFVNLPALEEKLRVIKQQTENLHRAANDTTPFAGEVTIQADKKVPFRVVKRVMYSCAAAGFGAMSFATLAEGSKGAVRGARDSK